ncbi:hypothetical protein [Actinoplanes rectilineatus]|uniref:hypothetical protein n=1 Tax=Actinoplanes rectilineatus TaxID=113571 RepID=UPI0005F289B5|nr:hypothetical protein [Actinoplanes rectilineatus]
MQVFLIDNADGKPVGGKYTLDTTFGVPATGDEIFLRSHDHHDLKKAYLAGTVRKRRWVYSDFQPESAYLEIWVQRHGS